MLAVLFFGKLVKIMLVMRNYAKSYASTIYQSLGAYSNPGTQVVAQNTDLFGRYLSFVCGTG